MNERRCFRTNLNNGRAVVTYSILVAVNDSLSSRNALDYLSRHAICREGAQITLLHVFRKPSASEELMGEKYMREQQAYFTKVLESAKERLVAGGLKPQSVLLQMVTVPYPTATEGILEQFKQGGYDLVVIGRRRKSKAEEFVLGDVGVKLVRALDTGAVLVVKS